MRAVRPAPLRCLALRRALMQGQGRSHLVLAGASLSGRGEDPVRRCPPRMGERRIRSSRQISVRPAKTCSHSPSNVWVAPARGSQFGRWPAERIFACARERNPEHLSQASNAPPSNCATFECAMFECAMFECAMFECAMFECAMFEGAMEDEFGCDAVALTPNRERGTR